MKYDFASIEKKWQQKWLEEKPFTAVTGDKTREKFFGLIEFPYPSGQGLHVGHAWTSSAGRSGCRATTSCSPSAMTPSACPQRTTPFSTTSTPPR